MTKDELCRMEQPQLVGMIERGGLVQVVHAEWIEFQGEYHCSHCQRLAPLNAYRKHTMRNDYCQNCGAKMDKERDHNEN